MGKDNDSKNLRNLLCHAYFDLTDFLSESVKAIPQRQDAWLHD